MAKFMFDAGRWSAAESWRAIRSARSEPPIRIASRVAKGERKVVFQTGLEQAQQQYAAASAVGYESRPLNLFYGLAQAGKALAAASPDLDQASTDESHKSWRTSSHGLAFSPTAGDFWTQRVNVEPGRADSFSRASIALGSTRDFDSIELGALAAQLPDFVLEWRSFGPWDHCLYADDAMAGGSTNGVFDLREYRGDMTAAAVAAYVARYPAIEGSDVVLNEDKTPASRTNDGWPYVVVPDSNLVKNGDYERWPLGAHRYGSTHIVVPRPEGSTGDLHPLMSWWMVLFGFSILARYHPKEWTEALAMGTSSIASQVEFLLDAAVTSVPELLARELWTAPWVE